MKSETLMVWVSPVVPWGPRAARGQSWWWDGLRPEWSRTRTRTRTRSWFSAELQAVDQNVSALIQHEVWVLFWSFGGFIFFPAVDQCEAAAVTKTTGLRSVSLTVTSPNITEPKWVYSFIESLMETWSGQKRWQASFLWERFKGLLHCDIIVSRWSLFLV